MSISATFINALRTGSKSLRVAVEFYESDAKPLFDPANANFLFGVAESDDVSFRGRDCIRLIPAGGVSDIDKVLSKTLSGCSVTLQNENGIISDFERNTSFLGLVCVIRLLDANVSVNLDDSYVLFTGSCEAAGDYSRSSNTYKVKVTQTLNQTEILAPWRTFSADDPNGRAQSDYLFQGFVFQQAAGSNIVAEKVASNSFLGRLFGKKKTIQTVKPFSSHSSDLENTAVTLAVGRTPLEAIIGVYIDKGTWIEFIGFFCDGHEYGIKTVENIRSVTPGITIPIAALKTGKQGGAVDDATHQAADDPAFVGNDEYSETVYIRGIGKGTTLESDDAAPRTVGLGFCQMMPTPDGAGNFTIVDLSDNPAAILRWFLSSPRYFNLSNEWHDDAENLISFNYNNQYLVDQQNTDALILPQSQIPYIGTQYNRFTSTALVTPKYVKSLLGTESIENALSISAEPVFYDDPPLNSDDPTGSGTPALSPTKIRRRYTLNGQLKEQQRAIDFLYDYWLAAANMYFTQQPSGQFAFKNRKPEDWSFFFTSSSIGAAEILVKNINPFAAKMGLILIGANLGNAEVREITGYRYKTDISINISASGGVSSSGNSLSGGSNTTAPNATLTVSAAAGTKTLNIGGFPLTYSPQAGETTVTAAFFLAASINSHNELNKFIKAVWNNNSTVTVSSRIGYLQLNLPLEFAHLEAIPNPSQAAGLTELSGGSLRGGTYLYCYSYSTLEGETLTSPYTSITIGENSNIGVPAIARPARVLEIKHYISIEANGVRLRLVNINQGEAFTISALPFSDDKLPPITNATAEMLHRVAMVFTDLGSLQTARTRSNIIKDSFAMPSKDVNINQIEITYFDAANDYKETTLRVNDRYKQKKAKKINKFEIKGAFIDNHHQAERIANQKLAELSSAVDYQWTSDNEALILQEAAVVCITDSEVGFVNRAISIDAISINPNGYPDAKLSGTPYRKENFDDQPSERLVPLPIIQNAAINQEQIAPVIYQSGAATNNEIPLSVTNYSYVPNLRKIQVSTDAGFGTSANIIETLQNSTNQVGFILGANFIASRSGDLSNALTVYVRCFHSSNNGASFGAPSNVVMATFTAADGSGGTPPEPTPEPGTETGTGDNQPIPPQNPCFIQGTLILMADRTEKPNDDVFEDNFVTAFNFKSGVSTRRRVSKVLESWHTDWLKVEFSDGRITEVLPEHPYWTFKNGNPAYVMIKSLRKGSSVYDPENNPVKIVSKQKMHSEQPERFITFEVEIDRNYHANNHKVKNLKPNPEPPGGISPEPAGGKQ